MTYRDNLRPWAIFRCLPNSQNECVVRLRTRTEADAYVSIFRQGGGEYKVTYDLVAPVKKEVTPG